MLQHPTDVDDPAKQVALDCLAAGIRAADPETVVADSLSFDGTALIVDGDAYDLGRYDDVVVGGGNAAGTAARALESAIGRAHRPRGGRD
jgi:hydroxypyruvate reductase